MPSVIYCDPCEDSTRERSVCVVAPGWGHREGPEGSCLDCPRCDRCGDLLVWSPTGPLSDAETGATYCSADCWSADLAEEPPRPPRR